MCSVSKILSSVCVGSLLLYARTDPAISGRFRPLPPPFGTEWCRFEVASNPRDVRDYSDCITHENLRVAVCSMVDDSRCVNFSAVACCQRSGRGWGRLPRPWQLLAAPSVALLSSDFRYVDRLPPREKALVTVLLLLSSLRIGAVPTDYRTFPMLDFCYERRCGQCGSSLAFLAMRPEKHFCL